MLFDSEDLRGGRILVVDDNPVNVELLADALEGNEYEVVRADSGERALEILKDNTIDTVLLDVMMPGLSGFDVCEQIKANPATHLLPVVLITALDSQADRVCGISSGADDFISKPFDVNELLARVGSCVRLKRLTDGLEDAESILVALANAIEAKDHYTEGHASRVAHYAVEVGRVLGLSEKQLRRLRLGGLLHDIGKIGVPEEVLNKPAALNDEEWKVMKAHPLTGDKICRPLRSLREILPIIRSHHERPDGSGYPDGLSGDEIPIEASIVGLADIYDALATTRSYKRAYPREKCIQILTEEADSGRLDPVIVGAFAAYLEQRDAEKRRGESPGEAD